MSLPEIKNIQVIGLGVGERIHSVFLRYLDMFTPGKCTNLKFRDKNVAINIKMIGKAMGINHGKSQVFTSSS